MRISREDIDKVPMICNPNTGQYVGLPQLRSKSDPRSLLGYDPVGKQYKVLAISNVEVHILTLGTSKMTWRKIKCHVKHYHISEGICINGFLYYIAGQNKGHVKNIACFDVRYEKLRFLNVDPAYWNYWFCSWPTKLIDYKGKLGVICWFWHGYKRNWSILEFRLWTLEDAQKQELLYHNYKVSVSIDVDRGHVSVVGATANGEIILSMDYTSNPFFVFYFNPERNTFERVGIQGFEAPSPRDHSRVYTFLDYAKDLKFM